MRNTILVLAILVVTATIATGCNYTEQKKATLEGTSWKMVAWSISSQDPSDFTFTAEFDVERMSGKSAVNQYGGDYKASADGIFELGQVAMTKMAGSEEEMKAEQNYHQLLSQANKYVVEGETLTFSDENGNQLLIFTKIK